MAPVIMAVAAGAAAAPVVASAAGSAAGWVKDCFRSSTEKWTVDLVESVANGDIRSRVYERESLLSRLIAAISANQGIVMLEGPAGVGKSALIEEIAHRIHEKKIPTLMKARILSVDLKRILGDQGLIRDINAVLFGNVSKAIKNLVEEVRAMNLEKPDEAIVLFIDEVQQLIDVAPNAFDELKDFLAREGVIIVCATTDEDLIQTWRARPEGSRGMDRRVESFKVPAMTPDEVLRLLEKNREEFAKQHRIAFDSEALAAIVNFTTNEPGNYPAKATKRLAQLAQYALNQKHESVTKGDVISYFSSAQAALPQELQKRLDAQAEREEFSRNFQRRYLPSLERGFISQEGRSVYEQLSNVLQGRAPQLIVQTDSLSVLREGLKQLGQRVNICSVTELEEIVGLDRENRTVCLNKALGALKSIPRPQYLPSQSSQPNIALAKKDFSKPPANTSDPILCIEASAGLLEQLVSVRESSYQQRTSVREEPLGRALREGSRLFGELTGVDIHADEVVRGVAAAPAPRRSANTPVIGALKKYIEQGRPYILVVRSEDAALVRAAEGEGRTVLSIPTMSPQQIMDWLRIKYPNVASEKLVWAVSLLKDSLPNHSVADFCDQVLGTLREEVGNQVAVISTILNLARGALRRDAVEEAFRRAASIGQIFQTGEQGVAQLAEFSLPLSRVTQTAAVKVVTIQETSRAQREFVTKLLLSEFGNNIASLDLSTIEQLSPALRKEIVDGLIQRIRRMELPRVIVKESDLKIGELGQELLKVLQERNAQVICFKGEAAAIASNPQASMVNEMMQAGANLLGIQALPTGPAASPSIWSGVSRSEISLGDMNSNQFSIWVRSLMPANGSEAMKRSLEKFYRELYFNSESAILLDEIADQFRFIQNPLEEDALIQHLAQVCCFSEREVTYILNPSKTSLIYRTYRGSAAFGSALLSPLKWVVNFFGGYVVQAVGWTSGGWVINGLARLLFRR